jgi:hypothetical protein
MVDHVNFSTFSRDKTSMPLKLVLFLNRYTNIPIQAKLHNAQQERFIFPKNLGPML